MTLNCVRVAVIGGLLLIGGTSASTAKVLGKDTRISIPDHYRQLARGIGTLYDSVSRITCTAFCVAPDVIMTNAHCVAWKKKHKNKKLGSRRRDVRDFVFRMIEKQRKFDQETLAWNNIEPIGRVEASVVFGREVKGVLGRKSNDWALAKLYRPMCAGDVLKIASPSDFRRLRRRRKQKVFMIGFHQDIAKRLGSHGKRFSRCVVRVRAIRRLAAHTCDAAPRSSGSPLLISTPDGPRVIAISQGGRSYSRWKRSQTGKKVITKRWYNNYGVLLFGMSEKVERLQEISFVHHSRRLEAEEFGKLLIKNGLLKNARKAFGDWRFQRAIRRYEKKRGWVPLGIPSQELVDALREDQ